MLCDDQRHYFVLLNVLPKSYDADYVEFPFNKRACNVIVYLSPPQCKRVWKIYEFGNTKTELFLPLDILVLLKGIRRGTGTSVSFELTDMQSLVTTFPKYVIVVQAYQMEFPLSLFYALDFDNMQMQHHVEFQAFKVLISVKDVKFKVENL